jgi:hypothetical protein
LSERASCSPRRIGRRRSTWRNASGSVGRRCGAGNSALPKWGLKGFRRDRRLARLAGLVAQQTHGAGGGADLHRPAAPDPALDRPGNGQSHRHLGGFGAAHLADAQTSAAPASHLQALARSRFAAKLTDIVGLYIDPPAHAVVLSIASARRWSRTGATGGDWRIEPNRAGHAVDHPVMIVFKSAA